MSDVRNHRGPHGATPFIGAAAIAVIVLCHLIWSVQAPASSIEDDQLRRARVAHQCTQLVPAAPAGDGSARLALGYVGVDKATTVTVTDHHAELAVAWRPDQLLVSIVVTDDHHVPADLESRKLWMGDSVQLAFDVGGNGGDAYDARDDYEFGFALGNDGQVRSHRWRAPTGAPPMTSSATITRSAGRTVYDITIPAADIGVERLTEGRELAFNVLVNERDGSEREGYAMWTQGIALDKRPADFDRLCLLPSR